MSSRFILLPFYSFIESEDEKKEIELTAIRIKRNEEKEHFEVAIYSHKDVIQKFSIKNMTLQVQQVQEKNDGLYTFSIGSKNKAKASFFVRKQLEKTEIEKIIKALII